MDRALRSLLDWYAKVGVDVPMVATAPRPRKRPIAKAAAPRKAPPSPERKIATPPVTVPISSGKEIASKVKTLDALRAALDSFNAGALSDGARQAVFARGNPEAKLMIIGEAPGRDEDIAGEPFIGPSGQLLDRMLGAIGLGAEDSYITNVVNWRPPNNRNPNSDEIELCRPFINRHIELVKPDILLLVGGVSLSAMTGVAGIMKQRGQWQEVTVGDLTLPALPIYHPAFLLRRPELKKDAWRDLLTLRARLLEG